MDDGERRAKAAEWAKVKTQRIAETWTFLAAGLTAEKAAEYARDDAIAAFLAGCQAETEAEASDGECVLDEIRHFETWWSMAGAAWLASGHDLRHARLAFIAGYTNGWNRREEEPAEASAPSPTCGECAEWHCYGEPTNPDCGNCPLIARDRFRNDPVPPTHRCTFTPRPPEPEPADDGFEAAYKAALNDGLWRETHGAERFARHLWKSAKQSQPKPDERRCGTCKRRHPRSKGVEDLEMRWCKAYPVSRVLRGWHDRPMDDRCCLYQPIESES